ncbi:hypothetical protein MXB_5346, partial [Myxobolus squamalis]
CCSFDSNDDSQQQYVYIQWLVINIHGGNYQIGRECIAYAYPSPTPNTGTHRYISALYMQLRHEECKPKFPEFSGSSKERTKRKLTEVIDQYGLIGPLAANAYFVDTATSQPKFIYD